MAGQPTLYNEQMQNDADDYITNYAEHGDAVPTVCGLACVLGVCEKTLYNWGDKNPQFLQTLERLQSQQKKVLVNKGLTGDFQPTIAKLMLSNHGIHEKSQHEIMGENGGPIEHRDLSKLTDKELETLEYLSRKTTDNSRD